MRKTTVASAEAKAPLDIAEVHHPKRKSKEMPPDSRTSVGASGNNFIKKYGTCAPAASLVVGLCTLFGIYVTARSSGHIPKGMWWPFISFLGFQTPERYIYVLGFSGTSVGIVVSSLFADCTLLSFVEPQLKWVAKTSYYAALIAAVGLVGQAIIPLQANIVDVISGKAQVVTQSIVHQSSAGVLFLAGYVHCITMNIVLHKSRNVPTSSFSKNLKIVLTVGMFAPVWLAFVKHPTNNQQGAKSMSLDEMGWGAVGQWIAVLSLLGYFASYHFEFTHPNLRPQAP